MEVSFQNEFIMATGTVKMFHKDKGFGFITPDDGGREIFVQRTAIQGSFRTLNEGDRVEFSIGLKKGQEEAQNVKVVGHVS